MRWSEQQINAIDVVSKRLAAGEAVTRMFGYAGTGKTTLAKELALQAAGSGSVFFAAFTGKAASVLTRKGCTASTIHSLIYRPSGDAGLALAEAKAALEEQKKKRPDDPKSDEWQAWNKDCSLIADRIRELRKAVSNPGFVFVPENSPLSQGAKLLVLDEVSMVDDAIAKDLLSFGVPILALGDPAQLPPVGGEGYFTRGGEEAADALLTDVQRHAGEVALTAVAVRRTGKVPIRRSVSGSEAASFDQILVGTNKTRWEKNRAYRRRFLGIDPDEGVQKGERIICLANNKDLGVLNGQQFKVLDTRDGNWDGTTGFLIQCECIDHPDINLCPVCGMSPHWIETFDAGFEGVAGEKALKELPYGRQRMAVHATFGYAITVHKSQGSEWRRVLVYDESRIFRKDARRWLYTAVTRAQEEIVVVRP